MFFAQFSFDLLTFDLIHYTTYMWQRRRLRGILYWRIPMLKQSLAAKQLSGQNQSARWRVFGNLWV